MENRPRYSPARADRALQRLRPVGSAMGDSRSVWSAASAGEGYFGGPYWQWKMSQAEAYYL